MTDAEKIPLGRLVATTDMIDALLDADASDPYEQVERVLAAARQQLSAGWLIWSNEHRMWWKSDRASYTADLMCAGRYTRDDALREANPLIRTELGYQRDVVVRAPSIQLLGYRDLVGVMQQAVDAVTRGFSVPQ